MRDIEELRHDIDDIDRKLVALFEARMSVVKEVAAYKKENDVPLKDVKRESDLIKKNVSLLENIEYAPFVEALYKDMMAYSRNYQKQLIPKKENLLLKSFSNKKIAFQGVLGAFGHEALLKFFDDKPKAYAKENFKDVFDSVNNDETDFGILPIENSSTGGIHDVYDLLKIHNLCIVGSYDLKIRHNLIGLDKTDIGGITKVYSHEQGFKQSKSYLNEHDWTLIPYFNTAKSVKYVSELNDDSVVAIGSSKAAEIYGLKILEEGIEDSSSNTTRFIVIAKNHCINENANRISIIITLPHEPGALSRILNDISNTNVNMLKIESRPIADHPWSYAFYIDFEGNIAKNNIRDLLESIKIFATEYYYLGNYISRRDKK